ncbi:glycoside hydrolase family 73 protein [Bacillus sp. FJAT-49736]|uniref:glycoside hydrolase family 73 protein n=1 Tax=Bacillus sp. FJAT-49736 TaxID=2833582 RepID=UPI001BC9D1FE|nr:glycoside hydrolase family 73 protein [Bacillus sp. FJAT-49736]MBS4172142.1 glycoside hydrolase family 73 protein [Bacillus sp. FJAT-49736]
MSFISEIAPHAQRIHKEYGVLASLVIAQAILESNWGKSGLAQKGKNLFGIKGSYNGQSVTMQTTEYKNGQPYKVNAAFRKYPSWYESLCDLANLFKNGVSWDRNKYKNIIGETDYKKAAKYVQSDGYATDPKYAEKLISAIESNDLTQYDNGFIVAASKPSSQQKGKTINGIKVLGQIQIVNVKNAAYICDKPSSTNSKNLDTAKKGSIWPIAGSIPGWYEIIYNGRRAYVNQKYAKRV